MAHLNVQVSGALSGPAIIFVHGLGCNSTVFGPVIAHAQLGSKYKIITFDLEGFGLSPTRNKPVSVLDDFVDNVKDVLDRTGVERAEAIVGFSLGGFIAMHFAAKYPHRLAKLFLLSPVRQFSEQTAPWLVNMAARVRHHRSVAPVAEWLALSQTADKSKEDPLIVHCIMTTLAMTHYEVYASTCDALTVALDPDFNAIGVPTLVVRGDQGEPCTPEVVHALQEGIAGVRVVTVEGGGHWGTFEYYKEVSEHLTGFLDK